MLSMMCEEAPGKAGTWILVTTKKKRGGVEICHRAVGGIC
jgi:hypothetical protein